MYLNLRILCIIAAILILIAGSLGMAISFLVLTSKNPAENLAGVAGFIAGAILVSGGLISLAILANGAQPAGHRSPGTTPGDEFRSLSR